MKYAYVILLMKGDRYTPGVLTVVQSLRKTKTKADIVVMTTYDVSERVREDISKVAKVVVVEYLKAPVKPLRTEKQREIYKEWDSDSFTKWRCLELTEYDKVIFVDADKIVLSNIDHLFEMKAPAGSFWSPWASPKYKNGMFNPYHDIQHGKIVPASLIHKALMSASFACIGTIVLLEPNETHMKKLVEMLNRRTPFGFTECNSGHDEQSIAKLYMDLGKDWTMIDYRYQFIPWRREWMNPDGTNPPFVYHYFNKEKPWDMERGKWEDMEPWWVLASSLVKEQSSLIRYFKEDELSKPPVNKCSFCSGFKLKDSHPTFNERGELECPKLKDNGI